MYWESIRALDDAGNGERLVIAGHLLRELQDRLPAHLPVPEVKTQPRLSDLFQWLVQRWQRVVAGSACRDGDGWRGEIDVHLGRFLRDLGKKVSEHTAARPNWKEYQKVALGSLDPALTEVPEIVQVAVVDRWLTLHDIFAKAAHHGPVDVATFEEAVREFEELLGDRIVPRTFEKQTDIRKMVMEAEGRADD